MSQGERVKDPTEKKKVPGWSIDEMKEMPNIAVEEDTEEMKRWRSLNQSEMEVQLTWLRLWSGHTRLPLRVAFVRTLANSAPSCPARANEWCSVLCGDARCLT